MSDKIGLKDKITKRRKCSVNIYLGNVLKITRTRKTSRLLEMVYKELSSTNLNLKLKLNLLITKLGGAFARVLACVRNNFLVKSRNCVSVRVKKTKISDKNKLIKRAANCCGYTPTKLFMIQKGT